MKNIMLRFLLILISLFLSCSLLAQKHFKLTINFPNEINIDKVEMYLDDGKTLKKISAQSKTKNQLVLTGDYYSIYAAVNLYYSAAPPVKTFANVFFIQEKPALIKIYTSDSVEYPFMNYVLENTLDFKQEKKQMENYVFEKRKIAIDYEARFGDTIFGDTALLRPYLKLVDTLRGKQLEYILNHLSNYYSFYSFRTDVVKSRAVSPDSMLTVFNAFPERFKYTDEGNYLNQFLQGRLSVNKMVNAVDFASKDISDKNVKLSDYKGKKYVLLHFWATWCAPCLKELPAVKKINDEFKSRDLQIISVALPSEYSYYQATIKKYHMDWINIYNDGNIVNMYGNHYTPRICLIDKDGKFIYDSIEFSGDVELRELNKILIATFN